MSRTAQCLALVTLLVSSLSAFGADHGYLAVDEQEGRSYPLHFSEKLGVEKFEASWGNLSLPGPIKLVSAELPAAVTLHTPSGKIDFFMGKMGRQYDSVLNQDGAGYSIHLLDDFDTTTCRIEAISYLLVTKFLNNFRYEKTLCLYPTDPVPIQPAPRNSREPAKYFLPGISQPLLSGDTSEVPFFHADIENNEPAELDGREYVFIGHPTSFWDEDLSSQEGVRKLMDFAKGVGIPVVATVDPGAFTSEPLAKKYFIKDGEADIIIKSNGGQHSVSFKNAKRIYFGGGNLSVCLCEGIRDVVRGNPQIYDAQDPVDLFIVTDAVYDKYPYRDPVRNIGIANGFIQLYFVPSFKCPEQNTSPFPNLSLDQFKLTAYLGDELIGEYKLQPWSPKRIFQLPNSVNVHFISTDQLPRYGR